jgi:RNA polymerase sigma-70 factor (ECF subfamily)
LKQPHFIDLANAPEKTDEQLYQDFLATKERDVMATIFRKHMSLVFGVCMKYIGERNGAQDATMEIFERLLTHEITSEIKNFRAYLFVMTKNHCLMKMRGEKHTFTEISERDMELATEVHPIDDEPRNEKALKKCLDQLKDVQKACVDQFYLKQKSYLEISSELKMTLNAVKSHIQNGKRNLKICIEGSQ